MLPFSTCERGASIRKRVLAAVEAATSHGASVVTNTEVLDFDEEGGRLKLITSDEPITCDKVVVATGSWTMRLRPDLRGYLAHVCRSPHLVHAASPGDVYPDRFPVFIRIPTACTSTARRHTTPTA